MFKFICLFILLLIWFITVQHYINYYLDKYIDEEDEIMLGPINLCKKIEDRDFVRRLFNV